MGAELQMCGSSPRAFLLIRSARSPRRGFTGVFSQGKTDWLVIGAGVNVKHHPHLTAETGAYPTTSLAECGSDITVPELLEAYLVALDTWLEILRDNGFTAIRTAWHDRARRGKITARVGGEVIEGDFLRLDDSGHLILRLADGGEKVIQAGDVFFL